MPDFREYIKIDPNVRFGRPVLKGTRIAVYDVLNWMANGMSFELKREMILACLSFAANREKSIVTTA